MPVVHQQQGCTSFSSLRHRGRQSTTQKRREALFVGASNEQLVSDHLVICNCHQQRYSLTLRHVYTNITSCPMHQPAAAPETPRWGRQGPQGTPHAAAAADADVVHLHQPLLLPGQPLPRRCQPLRGWCWPQRLLVLVLGVSTWPHQSMASCIAAHVLLHSCPAAWLLHGVGPAPADARVCAAAGQHVVGHTATGNSTH